MLAAHHRARRRCRAVDLPHVFVADVERGRRRAVPRSRHGARPHLPRPDLLLRRQRDRVSALLNARRRFFAAAWAPVLSNLVIIVSLLLVPGTSSTERIPQLDEVLTNDRAALDAGPRRDARHRRHGARLAARPACGRGCGSASSPTSAIRRSGRLRSLSDVDARLRRRQPGRDHRDPQPVARRQRRQDAYTKAYTCFVLPHGLLAMSIATTFLPEMASAIRRRDREARSRPNVARHPPDRARHPARRVRHVRAAPADRRGRVRSTASSPRPTRSTRRGARRLRPRPRRVLRRTCSCCACSTPTTTPAHRSSSTWSRT